MSCPGCGNQVGLDVAFCGVCGTPVGPQCPRCARQCRTGDRFCALCGAELAGEGADSMLSVFGAPVSREDDAGRALASALEMQRALDEVNALWSERLGRPIQIRIGV